MRKEEAFYTIRLSLSLVLASRIRVAGTRAQTGLANLGCEGLRMQEKCEQEKEDWEGVRAR